MNRYLAQSDKRIIAVAAGAGVNLLLFFAKLYIGLSTNSIAVYADSLNSLTDFGVCTAAAVGFFVASVAPDKNYPYGRGRAETLTELLVAAVIFASGFAFAYMSFERVLYPVPVWYSSLYAVIIAVTASVKLAMALLFLKASKKLGSDAVKGIAADSGLDFMITLCTLISFVLSPKAGFSVDGIAGILISLVLIVQGINAFRIALGKVLGKRNSKLCEEAEKFIGAEFPSIKINELHHHAYGERGVFTAVIEVDYAPEETKNLSMRMNEKMKEKFGSELYVVFGGER